MSDFMFKPYSFTEAPVEATQLSFGKCVDDLIRMLDGLNNEDFTLDAEGKANPDYADTIRRYTMNQIQEFRKLFIDLSIDPEQYVVAHSRDNTLFFSLLNNAKHSTIMHRKEDIAKVREGCDEFAFSFGIFDMGDKGKACGLFVKKTGQNGANAYTLIPKSMIDSQQQ